MLRYSIEDRKQIRKERQEGEARKVGAWCDNANNKYVLYAQNFGDEPIYDFVAYVGLNFPDFNIPPEPDNMYMDCVFGMLPPGKELDFLIDQAENLGGDEDHFPNLPAVAWEFTDGSGRHWRRESSGKINQTSFRRPFD